MSVQYTIAAVSALIDNDTLVIKERRGRNNFHAFQVELKALQSKTGESLGPVAKGRLLGAAQDALVAAGYEVEDRSGYSGQDNKFVNWPHLRIVEPNSYVDAGASAAMAIAQSNAAALAQLTALITAQLGAVPAVVTPETPAVENTFGTAE